MAEVAKIAMALDGDLFEKLEAEADRYQPSEAELLTPVVRRAIELKAWIVERDERESGDRMLLNYGHTVGHALEAASTYTALLHGEAISVGMEAASFLARGMGLLSDEDAQRQTQLLRRLDLPIRFDGVEPNEVLDRLESDKKRQGAVQRWILARRVGEAEIRDDVPEQLVREAVQAVLR
jgi:3-dehydroquinate synthase